MKIEGSDSLERLTRSDPARPGALNERGAELRGDGLERPPTRSRARRSVTGRSLAEALRAATAASVEGASLEALTPERSIELLRYVTDEVLPSLPEQDDILELSARLLDEEIDRLQYVIAMLGQDPTAFEAAPQTLPTADDDGALW